MYKLNELKKVDPDEELLGMRVEIEGYVQGVGFRPFVYRLAKSLRLKGWISNSTKGVLINVEGCKKNLEDFLVYLEKQKPPHSSIRSIDYSFLKPHEHPDFEIRPSISLQDKITPILPDISTCADCLGEVFDPKNRRHRYPFTNCTNCGPRFSIVRELPYDRANTTMKKFIMCDTCKDEYHNPSDRRFHAETNCCEHCGPQIELWDSEGNSIVSKHESVLRASDYIKRGAIVAVKGIGGFHLIADARNQNSIRRLRLLKNREEKPFALMCPSFQSVIEHCELSQAEESLLSSAESPIVLLRRKPSDIAYDVAPENPYIGVMLPYTPLHHILMTELNFPVVATSGNISDEPITTDEHEAIRKLNGIADFFLVHNRPIAHHVDDSVARIIMNRKQLLRAGRGYAPLSIELRKQTQPTLAAGGQLKNTVAISNGKVISLSPHIGNLGSFEAVKTFEKVIADFNTLYDFHPQFIACDSHPDYYPTHYAEKQNVPVLSVQHHYAHVLACMEERMIEAPALGVSWDGTGYGSDGTIWGGEFLKITKHSFDRIGHFRNIPLPGGEKAVKEPRRAALGLLHEIFKNDVLDMDYLATLKTFSHVEINILISMIQKKLNTPLTSSVGRLFDAVSSILGLCQYNAFEGKAAMKLEFAMDDLKTEESYDYEIINLRNQIPSYIIDWAPTIKAILDDLNVKTPVKSISTKFHNTLVEIIISMARHVGEEKVVLTGGCFQNKYLLNRTIERLNSEGFSTYWPELIPPNDGGIALGQIVAASRIIEGGLENVLSSSWKDTQHY